MDCPPPFLACSCLERGGVFEAVAQSPIGSNWESTSLDVSARSHSRFFALARCRSATAPYRSTDGKAGVDASEGRCLIGAAIPTPATDQHLWSALARGSRHNHT